MSSESVGKAVTGWPLLESLIRDGSSHHGFVAKLRRPSATRPLRDLADAVHHVCLLHGRHPGVVDHAGLHTVHPAARQWLVDAAEGFAAERAQLTRLVVAAGPLPSTPGHAEAEAAVMAQRHALDMLSQSDRVGCAAGAAIALVLDWQGVRAVMEAAGEGFGVALPASLLPEPDDTLVTAAAVADSPAVERALLFGVQQMIAQQRGLWDLLDARSEARAAA